jgi:hypothetical protein
MSWSHRKKFPALITSPVLERGGLNLTGGTMSNQNDRANGDNHLETVERHRDACVANLHELGRRIKAMGQLVLHGRDANGVEGVIDGTGEIISELGDRVRHVANELRDEKKVSVGQKEPAKHFHQEWNVEE